jgi:repressor LexA
MASEHFREVSRARRRQDSLRAEWLRRRRGDNVDESANRMASMERSDHAPPRGAIIGIVWAGEPDADPVMESAPTEGLLDEFNVGTHDYFLRVRGLSMKDADIVEGDLVQIRPVNAGTQPPDGSIVLAEIGLSHVMGERSGRATIKRFFREGTKIRLQPANNNLSSQLYESVDVIILGRVVNVIRQIRPV